MSDELKAARERLWRIKLGEDIDDVYQHSPFLSPEDKWDYDRILLSDEYLIEHQADDDEPITAEWLLTCGAVIERVQEARYLNLPRHDMEAGVTFYQVIGPNQPLECKVENAGGSGFWLQHIKTRGDVRRLCKALGVPLEEP